MGSADYLRANSSPGKCTGPFSRHTIAPIAGSTICTTIMLMALNWPRPRTGARPQIAFGPILARAAGNLKDPVVFARQGRWGSRGGPVHTTGISANVESRATSRTGRNLMLVGIALCGMHASERRGDPRGVGREGRFPPPFALEVPG